MTTAPEDQSEREALLPCPFCGAGHAPKVEAMQLDARWYTVSTERAMRTAFNVKHPFGDEVPGALREAFFELFKQGWSAALSNPLPALAPLQVDNKPQG
jgi:hypothetical protein